MEKPSLVFGDFLVISNHIHILYSPEKLIVLSDPEEKADKKTGREKRSLFALAHYTNSMITISAASPRRGPSL